MFYKDEVINDYFHWLIGIISDGNEKSYSMLLKQLFDTTFIYTLEKDANRAHDGLDLRDRYSYEMDSNLSMSSPCTVLEMMIALAIRCENDVMYNPERGDRTYIWFWMMIENLGLMKMVDRFYNHSQVKFILINFMERNYELDGNGSLFYIPGARNMQSQEIWYQMNTFLSSIVR